MLTVPDYSLKPKMFEIVYRRVTVSFFDYSETCVRRPYKTIHILGCSDRWLLIDTWMHELLFSNKQPPVNSDFHVT